MLFLVPTLHAMLYTDTIYTHSIEFALSILSIEFETIADSKEIEKKEALKPTHELYI